MRKKPLVDGFKKEDYGSPAYIEGFYKGYETGSKEAIEPLKHSVIGIAVVWLTASYFFASSNIQLYSGLFLALFWSIICYQIGSSAIKRNYTSREKLSRYGHLYE